MVKRPFSKQQNNSSNINTNTGNVATGQGGTKGKLNKIRRKWRWGAGATILSVLDWWLLAAGGWLTWRGVFLRWTPIGFCLMAAAHWHLHNQEMDRKGLPRTASQWQVLLSKQHPSAKEQTFHNFLFLQVKCLLLVATSTYEQMLGMVSRTTSTDINAADDLWPVFINVWC